MLEAVTPVIQNAQVIRAVAETAAASESVAANPDRAQRTAPQAPYVSPYIFMDVNYDKAVLQIRNSDTGDVLRQFPSESRLQALAEESASKQRPQVAVLGSETRQEQQAPVPTTTRAESTTFVAQETSAAPQVSAPAETTRQPVTQQQIAAFQSAAQSGNSNAGNVTVFA